MTKKKAGLPKIPKYPNKVVRLQEGQSFWIMSGNHNDGFKPLEKVETKYTTQDDSSLNGILARNGNYYYTEQACINRINYLKQK